jgi:hypothetical protein
MPIGMAGTSRFTNEWALRLLLAMIFFAGATLSYKVVLGYWSVDDDIVDLYMLWKGISQHGLHYLGTWSYTADNWLLSLLPPYSLLYDWFGPRPGLLVGVGWFIFVLDVLLTALIIYRVAGSWYAGIVACVLIFPHYMVLGPAGLLGHPVTHNSSLAWVLLALLLALQGIKTFRARWHIASALTTLVVCLSDPWAIPVFLFPVTAISLLLGYWPGQQLRHRDNVLTLGFCMLVVVLLTKTRLFGLFSFLPPYYMVYPTWAKAHENLHWIIQAFGIMFPTIPTYDPTLTWSWSLSLLALVAAIAFALWRFATTWASTTLSQQFTVLISITSIGGVVLANVVGQPPQGLSTLHLLINAYFLIPLMIVVALSLKECSKLAIGAIVTWAFLLIATGMFSASSTARSQTPASTDLLRSTKPLAEFLKGQNLTYGYGPYWGAHANAVTWYTRGGITIRPVRFDPLTGRIINQHEQSSSLWTHDGDIPADQGTFFIAVGNDGEVCPDVNICIAGVIAQFGKPEKTLHFITDRADLTIFVWSHSLVSPGTLLPAAATSHQPGEQ